jgi:undecaprenyl-diphosphatase
VAYVAELCDAMSSMDRMLFLAVNHRLPFPGGDFLMAVLSDRRAGLCLAGGLILLLFTIQGRHAAGAIGLTLAAVLLANLGADCLKLLVQRVRPCHVIGSTRLLVGCTGSFAFPSNHASNLFAIAGVAWATGLPWRWPAALIALGGGISRVYLGVHYPGDVVAGAILGLLVAAGVVATTRSALPRIASVRLRMYFDCLKLESTLYS